ncbi:mannose-P-dolichol utilization defect 1 [Marchantia polymorpha subsp. ruderalis]|uniref:Mannose-P-dolichol utilization defect 1 protein homolog n=1 Tax=Marchantia polymorpha TaxID=3197 RepID=A0A2R6X2J3_MARPO|nr:hypothetical protein MARPO_0040s0013 [Marchantia polymorpha]PTQ40328.1 hypothetical protein MARPO_0040s0013 [Marchantia polymorpha]BBN03249.1 hypothetical protein Mp_2g22020 [Marchantia polymorpha subsp. ruderalis]BBN03250.1 hypothetical protein Mp_2g22020 [Marchantia polymorpha subsp. ruderalis]|eukprot:PTQ40327.1 hypothetical protein MARPO_0040s0013 [Marchantia polymorpha]
MSQFELWGMNFTCMVDPLMLYEIPPKDCVLPLLSKILGYCIVAASGIVKLPQILIIMKSRSIKGLSKTSFEMEVVGFTIALSYCIYKRIPFSAYGELVFLLLQGIFLLLLIYYHSTNLGPATLVKTALYCALAPTLLAGNVSENVMETLYASQHAIFFLSRIPQIYDNFVNKSTGQLSFLTNFMVFGGCIVRLFTSIQENAPSSMILGSCLGLLTNGTVFTQLLMYRGQQVKDKTA